MHSNNAKASISENALSKSENILKSLLKKVAFVEQTQVGKYKTSNDLNLVDFDMYTTGGNLALWLATVKLTHHILLIATNV